MKIEPDLGIHKEKQRNSIRFEMDSDIDIKTYKQMIFIYNAVSNGWSVKKRNESYIFRKKHQGKQEVYKDSYLSTFIQENCIFENE